MKLILSRSPQKNKKWRIVFPDRKSVHFGHSAYEDYTMHKDDTRKKSYVSRHKSSENWNKSGIRTAGFWSKHRSSSGRPEDARLPLRAVQSVWL